MLGPWPRAAFSMMWTSLSVRIGSSVPLHQVAVCTHGYLATTKLDIYFEGVPAHAGANPEKAAAHSWQPALPP